MITNPPEIYDILTAYHGHCKSAPPAQLVPEILSTLFRQHLGPQNLNDFLKTYQLYLQSIPFETAKEAWGISFLPQTLTKS